MRAALAGLAILASFLLLAPAGNASATDVLAPDACNNAQKSAVCTDKSKVTKDDHPITDLISKITLIIAVVAGIIAVIMIIISGFRFIVSGGESQKVAGARNNLLSAIIGLVIIALAGVIFSFVVSRL